MIFHLCRLFCQQPSYLLVRTMVQHEEHDASLLAEGRSDRSDSGLDARRPDSLGHTRRPKPIGGRSQQIAETKIYPKET
ncbi:MAG: hypothetical protein CL694_10975 [Chloroflexi bacterium]|jgi:hypothetical protein|nr:hypothetical protein [Chloroflexota bacterium]|tara:strand:+ start:1124 stop:1360 length:237 start_codon:yes stop_codon:yes gene_type:complete